jgi:hypothetical protein
MTVAERASALTSTPVFQSFAGSLEIAQRDVVARILALYRANDLAIQSQAVSDDQRLRMHTQLLQDTLAQLRARLPEPAWKRFLHSGLIPDIADTEKAST